VLVIRSKHPPWSYVPSKCCKLLFGCGPNFNPQAPSAGNHSIQLNWLDWFRDVYLKACSNGLSCTWSVDPTENRGVERHEAFATVLPAQREFVIREGAVATFLLQLDMWLTGSG